MGNTLLNKDEVFKALADEVLKQMGTQTKKEEPEFDVRKSLQNLIQGKDDAHDMVIRAAIDYIDNCDERLGVVAPPSMPTVDPNRYALYERTLMNIKSLFLSAHTPAAELKDDLKNYNPMCHCGFCCAVRRASSALEGKGPEV